MKQPGDNEHQLRSKVYLKTQADMAWPDDKFYYLLTSDGLFVCRTHDWFRSCVPARRWPSELATQRPFLVPAYPKIPQRTMERVVGFFSIVADELGSEAGVLFVWDRRSKQVQTVVPDQVATVSRNYWGDTFPIGLEYEIPHDLPDDWVVLGSAHSHVNGRAVPSGTDDRDETHRAGVHVIVGLINREPPDFHAEAVVDGTRFDLLTDRVMEGYYRRSMDVPQAWVDKVKPKVYGAYQNQYSSCSSSRHVVTGGYNGTAYDATPANGDWKKDSNSTKSGKCTKRYVDLSDSPPLQLPDPDKLPHSTPVTSDEGKSDDES